MKNKKQLVDYFKKLEVSENDANLYFVLLEHGSLTARTLAQKIGIKRTTAYNYIDHLMEKGIIMKSINGVRTFLTANPPEQILPDLVYQRIQEDKGMQETLPQILTALQNFFPLKTKSGINAEIRSYKGKSNVRRLYEEALQANELRAYAKIEEKDKLFPNNVTLFKNAFKKNKKLKVWEILYDSPPAIKDAQQVLLNTHQYLYKLMPPNLKLSSEDILIYDGKVAIINYQSNFVSVVLESADYYNNSKALFDYIWETLPDEK